MKKLVALLFVLSLFLVALPASASAAPCCVGSAKFTAVKWVRDHDCSFPWDCGRWGFGQAYAATARPASATNWVVTVAVRRQSLVYPKTQVYCRNVLVDARSLAVPAVSHRYGC